MSPPGVIVVAKRWDGFGGRLCAILNALSTARALGLEFGFVWPRTTEWGFSEPRELFDDAFLARFEIAESFCENRVVLPDPTRLNLVDAKKLCLEASASSVIYIDECFKVVAFAEESEETARARFQAGLDEIRWSLAVLEFVASVSEDTYSQGYSALHVRAGDIVTGDWRQFVPVEKYVPKAYVEFAIETLSGPDCDPVVVVSDNEAYARHLKGRFSQVRLPADIFSADYSGLTDIQRAFADTLALSRARRIVGPRASAFSGLAARLGEATVLGIDELTTEGNARRLLCDGISRGEKDAKQTEVLRPLLVRDICWYHDVFSDDMAINEQIRLAGRAAELEPDFCGGHNRYAAALALAGRYKESRKASTDALVIAAKVERHADPLLESLATSVSAEALAYSAQPRRTRSLLARLGLDSVLGRSGRKLDRNTVLDALEQSRSRCEELEPFQINHGEVMQNLRFQISALSWLMTTNYRLSEIARAKIEDTNNGPPFLQLWRPSGFSGLRAVGLFPHVLRNLEVTTIRIAQAIGAALSNASLRPPPLGRVDGMTTCPSGLRWVRGWAYDANASGTPVAVGYVCNEAIASGGVTSLARPDVAAALKDPRAMNCGFALPVPLSVQDIGDLQSDIRMLRSGS